MIEYPSIKYKWLKCSSCKVKLFAGVSTHAFKPIIYAKCPQCLKVYRLNKEYVLDVERGTFSALHLQLRGNIDA